MSTAETVTAQRRRVPRQVSFQDQKPPTIKSKATKTAKRHSLLRRWSDLPDWQKQDGKIIYGGYREPTPSITKCVQSWFYLHNESVNIFTHLCGALLFVGLAFLLYEDLSFRYKTWSTGDVMAFGVFMFGVATCFALSAAFHTCASHSQDGYHVARRLDFQGIIVLVLSTSAPQTYYTFFTEPTLRTGYWSLIIAFGIMASIATFTPSFEKPSHYTARVAVFAGLGFSTFAPILHGCILHGVNGQTLRFPLWAVGLTHTFNIFGAVVYVLHFPERWWPGTFDIFGASHQLMHTAIIGAALTLLVGSLIAFDNAHSEPC